MMQEQDQERVVASLDQAGLSTSAQMLLNLKSDLGGEESGQLHAVPAQTRDWASKPAKGQSANLNCRHVNMTTRIPGHIALGHCRLTHGKQQLRTAELAVQHVILPLGRRIPSSSLMALIILLFLPTGPDSMGCIMSIGLCK